MPPREWYVYRFDKNFPDWSLDAFDSEKFMKKWFQGGPEVDKQIRDDFGSDVDALGKGSYDNWLNNSIEEGLAGVILMDQFTRNMYRGTAKMCAAPSL